MTGTHEELLGIAEHQLELAEAGRWDELPAAMELFARRAATLPAVPPPSAAGVLRRAAQVAARVEELVRAGRMETARDLSRLQRGRGAVRSYEAGALERGGQVDGTG